MQRMVLHTPRRSERGPVPDDDLERRSTRGSASGKVPPSTPLSISNSIKGDYSGPSTPLQATSYGIGSSLAHGAQSARKREELRTSSLNRSAKKAPLTMGKKGEKLTIRQSPTNPTKTLARSPASVKKREKQSRANGLDGGNQMAKSDEDEEEDDVDEIDYYALVEDYLDLVEQLPLEVARDCVLLKDLDGQAETNIVQLKQALTQLADIIQAWSQLSPAPAQDAPDLLADQYNRSDTDRDPVEVEEEGLGVLVNGSHNSPPTIVVAKAAEEGQVDQSNHCISTGPHENAKEVTDELDDAALTPIEEIEDAGKDRRLVHSEDVSPTADQNGISVEAAAVGATEIVSELRDDDFSSKDDVEQPEDQCSLVMLPDLGTLTFNTPEHKAILSQISTLLNGFLTVSEEKQALALATYNTVDRHIRRLDDALVALEEEIVLGVREGTAVGRLDEDGGFGAKSGTLFKRAGLEGRVGESDEGDSKPGRKKKKKRGRPRKKKDPKSDDDADDQLVAEPTYCFCNKVSSGDMVACDNEDCEREWFHYDCVGLQAPPKGRWYCRECADALNIKR